MTSQGPNSPASGSNNPVIGRVSWNPVSQILAQDFLNATGTSLGVSGSTSPILDYSVRLSYQGAMIGANMIAGSGTPLSQIGPSPVNYGGNGFMWGVNLTPAQVNDPTFGVGYSVIFYPTESGTTISNYIVASSFGFSIPSNATIVGIGVVVWSACGLLPSNPAFPEPAYVDYISMQVYYHQDPTLSFGKIP